VNLLKVLVERKTNGRGNGGTGNGVGVVAPRKPKKKYLKKCEQKNQLEKNHF